MESTNPNVNDGKTIAILSYLTIIGLIIAFVMNHEKRNTFASFHIRQSVGLMFLGIIIMLLGNLSSSIFWGSSFLSFGLFILWVFGFLNALNGKEEGVPVFGEYFKKWFAGIY